ncbi:MAG: G8 domain-containing protein, partial [Bacteroidales bacterium]|nr:G8 domain-containing protein [Bacteroidales bacterium]
MKHSVFLKIIFLSFLILFYQNLNASDIQSNGSGGGAWNIGTTWDGGVVPSAGDNVTIKSTDVVKIQQNVVNSPNNLTIIGTLTFGTGGSYSLTVSGDLLINSGGKLNVEADETNTNSHSLNLSGYFTNNGTFTSISGDDKINVIFQAVKDVSLSGTSQTDFQGLTINLTAGKTLDITSVITFPGAAEFTLTSGIFKLSSASTITPFSG